ncbi:salicylate synthase [Streptomyces sp. NPDC005438]|uniref:salicylate synthase n=1 Tax=Streptomyces sp. NPDC005438 TaxID=3156880 RepID=UPI0033BAD8FC
MSHRRRYLERELAVSCGPLRNVARLASSGVLGGYVVFEKHGRYQVCADPLAEIRLDGDRLRAWYDGESVTDERTADPLRRIGRCLDALPVESWRAYGWTAFELGCALAGVPVGEQRLAHLVVPRVEVELTEGHARVRALTAQALDTVTGLLTASETPAPAATPRRVDTDQSGAQTYQAAVRLAVEDIRAGRLQKVILSRTVPVDFDVDLVATYVHGRENNTPARSFLLDLDGTTAAGFSPETVLETEGGHVTTQPLAGTRRRSADPAETRRLRAELYASDKEILEHAVSVKTSVEELGTVCRPGSVRVADFMGIRERGSVQHLASRVSGDLAPGSDVWDAFAATFPAVTASGIPKAAAYECLRRLETEPRGLYAGAVLTVDSDGAMDAALVLRTVYQSGDRTWLRAGAGIVEQSDPEREYEETREKLESVSRYLVPAAPGGRSGARADVYAEAGAA